MIHKTKLLTVLLFAVTFCACSSTVQLNSPFEANHRIGKGEAEIHLSSGKVLNVRSIHVEADHTVFINREDNSFMQLPNSKINSICITSYPEGVIEGFGTGVCFGAVAGVTVSILSRVDSKSSGASASGPIILGALIGGVAGTITGAVKGHDYTFVFPADSLLMQSENSLSPR